MFWRTRKRRGGEGRGGGGDFGKWSQTLEGSTF